MCGLLAAMNTKIDKKKPKPVNEWILDQYEDQCHRGQKGFGIIYIDEKGKVETKRATEPLKFLLDLNLYESNKIIAHHRTPTSTDNKISQTHPIIIKNKMLAHDYMVIHNGIIQNDEDLKISHEKLGFVYTTEEVDTRYSTRKDIVFNDSEAVAIESVLFIEKKKDVIDAKGSMAVIALQINRKTQKAEKMFFFRNGNPLNMSKTRGKIRLSSEGEGNAIEENVMYNCEITGDMKLLKRTINYKKEETRIITKEVIKSMFPEARRVYSDSMGTYTKVLSTAEIERERRDEIECSLAQEARDVEVITIDEKMDEYIEQEMDSITDVISDFNLELSINPTAIDVHNTLELVREILLRMKDTATKTAELFQRTGGQVETKTIKRVLEGKE